MLDVHGINLPLTTGNGNIRKKDKLHDYSSAGMKLSRQYILHNRSDCILMIRQIFQSQPLFPHQLRDQRKGKSKLLAMFSSFVHKKKSRSVKKMTDSRYGRSREVFIRQGEPTRGCYINLKTGWPSNKICMPAARKVMK
jgi:hypothetical protein